jgi:hypothetical protein
VEAVGRGELEHRVTDAIGELQTRIQAVEIWAAAVVGFSQPIPDDHPPIRGVKVLED